MKLAQKNEREVYHAGIWWKSINSAVRPPILGQGWDCSGLFFQTIENMDVFVEPTWMCL